MQYDDTKSDVVAAEASPSTSDRARISYCTPDVDTVVPAMIPQLLGTTVCSAPEAGNDPFCDAT